MKHILTIDLEEWFHVCGAEATLPPSRWDELPGQLPGVLSDLLDLLDRVEARATFFVVGYIADRYPELVREIRERGHRIGCHGYLHKRIYDMTPAEFTADLDRAVNAIERACGVTPISYRSPEWSLRRFCLWAVGILASRGFQFDSSAVPMSLMGWRKFPHHPVTIQTEHGPIMEVPLTTARCGWERVPYTGGLGFRFTTEWYVHRQIRHLEARGRPAVIYVHPFDIVSELPEASLPLTRRLMQRFGKKSGPGRIIRLLSAYRYAPLEEVCGGAPVDEKSPRKIDPGFEAHLRRSAWITGFGIAGLTVGAGLIGAALGPIALLIPPAGLAAIYGNHLKHTLACRKRQRRAHEVDSADKPVVDAAPAPDRLSGDSPDSPAGA